MPFKEIAVDDGPHNMDGLLLHAWDGSERMEVFISRRVMDNILREQELLAIRSGHERIADMQFALPTQERS